MKISLERLNDYIRQGIIQLVDDVKSITPGQKIQIKHNTGKVETIEVTNASPFQNGRSRAEQEIGHKIENADYYRLPKNVVGNELYSVTKELQSLYQSLSNGNDLKPEQLDSIIRTLQSIRGKVTRNTPE